MFVHYYCENGFNALQAYRSAYSAPGKEIPADQTAGTLGHLLLKNIQVQEGIHTYLESILAPSRTILEKQIFDTLWKRAFYDPSMFLDLDGEVRTIDDPETGIARAIEFKDIPEEWRCVIDGIEKKYFGKDAVVYSIVLKLADRDKALDKLDKYIGMTKDTKVIEITEVPAERKKQLRQMVEEQSE